MFKSLLSKLLLLVPVFSSWSHAEPLVWMAQDSQRQFILLGSIHAGHPSLYPLPQAFLNHWRSANALVVEANILAPNQARINPAIPLTENLLSTEEKTALLDTARKAGLKVTPLLKSPPWLAAIQLQMKMADNAGLSPAHGIDMTLLRRAEKDQLPIKELESVQQQITLMEQLDDHGKDLLMATVGEWEQLESQLQCMISAWQAGDLAQLQRIFDDSHYSAKTDELLIYARNRDWANQMASEYYPPGKYLVVVGAMHLLGPQGLPALLSHQGFTLEPLTQSAKAICPSTQKYTS